MQTWGVIPDRYMAATQPFNNGWVYVSTASAISIINTTNALSSGAGTSFTASSASIGTAASDRIVVVAAAARRGGAGAAIQSVTVGSCSLDVQISQTSTGALGTANHAAIWSGTMGSTLGSAANITVSSTGVSLSGYGISVFSITGAAISSAGGTGTATSSSTTATANITYAANSVSVGIACAEGSGASPTHTFSANYTTIISTYGVDTGNFVSMGTAMSSFVTGASTSITDTLSVGGDTALVVASWS